MPPPHGNPSQNPSPPLQVAVDHRSTTASLHEYEEEEVEEENKLPIPNPAMWFAKLVSLQADITYDCLVCLLSPFISLMSIASESAEEAKESVNTAVHAAIKVPSKVVHGGTLLLKKLGFGLLGVAYVGLVLVSVMFLAVLLGVGSVQLWPEEPVFLWETLHFDYADEHPKAVFDFLGGGGGGFEGFRYGKRKRVMGVPVGHTFYVTLVLLMPESDFNREIGMLQTSREKIAKRPQLLIGKASESRKI
ncbi:hypothetical protein RJ639_023420 [Escallonia herrerae]|uniref:Uncharacterized protein n=1 Tax=Escallonia herrerae TaxID=1293975 RepID=A0AA88V0S1_9ASTE|nr:hypothetical protein RJ639_023420 [Escallonia herrerae]